MENTSSNQRFIEQTFDKFTDKKETTLKWPAKFSKQYYKFWFNAGDSDIKDYKGLELDLTMRHVKTPDLDALLIDYTYLGADWMFFRNGSMVINLNGTKNITLECHESNTEVGVGFYNACFEVGFYRISKEDLKKVCDAKELEVRMSGGSSYHAISNKAGQENTEQAILPGDKFLFMCRAFYAGLYDVDIYNAQLEEVIPLGSENVKAPGAGAGCFIATAAMGDYDHPVVLDLRLFRDNWLLKRNWGINFTNWYYTHGPKAASVIEKSTSMKKLTFYLVVKPLQIITRNLK